MDEFVRAYLECALWATIDDREGHEGEALDKLHQAGHDLFLTRCGHGCGFWSREEEYTTEENEVALTQAAEEMGEVWFYVGDDGKIYST